MKRRSVPSSTAVSDSASAEVTCVRAAQLIEAVKIYIAGASAVIDEKARIMEERATQAQIGRAHV